MVCVWAIEKEEIREQKQKERVKEKNSDFFFVVLHESVCYLEF